MGMVISIWIYMASKHAHGLKGLEWARYLNVDAHMQRIGTTWI